MHRRRSLWMVLLILGLLVLPGTSLAKGAGKHPHGSAAGWIASAGPDRSFWTDDAADAKAHLAINFQVKRSQVRGKFRYRDEAAGVDLMGSIEGWADHPDLSALLGFTIANLTGTYQPKDGGEQGKFIVGLNDFGEKGQEVHGLVSVKLEGGAYDGYENFCELLGGNVQLPDSMS